MRPISPPSSNHSPAGPASAQGSRPSRVAKAFSKVSSSLMASFSPRAGRTSSSAANSMGGPTASNRLSRSQALPSPEPRLNSPNPFLSDDEKSPRSDVSSVGEETHAPESSRDSVSSQLGSAAPLADSLEGFYDAEHDTDFDSGFFDLEAIEDPDLDPVPVDVSLAEMFNKDGAEQFSGAGDAKNESLAGELGLSDQEESVFDQKESLFDQLKGQTKSTPKINRSSITPSKTLRANQQPLSGQRVGQLSVILEEKSAGFFVNPFQRQVRNSKRPESHQSFRAVPVAPAPVKANAIDDESIPKPSPETVALEKELKNFCDSLGAFDEKTVLSKSDKFRALDLFKQMNSLLAKAQAQAKQKNKKLLWPKATFNSTFSNVKTLAVVLLTAKQLDLSHLESVNFEQWGEELLAQNKLQETASELSFQSKAARHIVTPHDFTQTQKNSQSKTSASNPVLEEAMKNFKKIMVKEIEIRYKPVEILLIKIIKVNAR